MKNHPRSFKYVSIVVMIIFTSSIVENEVFAFGVDDLTPEELQRYWVELKRDMDTRAMGYETDYAGHYLKLLEAERALEELEDDSDDTDCIRNNSQSTTEFLLGVVTIPKFVPFAFASIPCDPPFPVAEVPEFQFSSLIMIISFLSIFVVIWWKKPILTK